MTLDEFEATLGNREPPEVSGELKALWWDGNGNWDRAHQTVQDLESGDAAWVHAYLHRKEGDLSNARYWYRRASQTESQSTLDSEWRAIADALLLRSGVAQS